MSIAYITEQGAFLTKEGDVLLVKKGKEQLQAIHAHQLEQLVITGNVTLTTQTIAFLLEKGIDTVFMSVYGKYRGRLSSRFSRNIEIRQLQFIHFADPAFALGLARQFVLGKVQNCLSILRRRLLTKKSPVIRAAVLQLRGILNKIPGVDNIDTLRGFEGSAAAAYFKGFGHMLVQEDFIFIKRTRRPPLDMTNALLSLGYTFLNNTIQSIVDQSGLDPYYGAFHQAEYGRPSLGLDLMEEFRPVITDILVLNLINKVIISKDDFVFEPESELPVKLNALGMKKVIMHYEKRLQQIIYLPEQNKHLNYRQIIQQQFFKIQRHLEGKEAYAPFILRR